MQWQDDIEDDNDAAWAEQQQHEQELLDDDLGYVEFLATVALHQLNSRTI